MAKMYFFRILIGIAIIYVTCANAAPTMMFDHNAESGNITGLNCSGNCPSATTAAKFAGNYGYRFYLNRNTSSVPYRTEISVTPLGPVSGWSGANEYWIGYVVKFKDWPFDTDGDIAPFQIHDRPLDWSTWSTCLRGGQVGFGPASSLTDENITFLSLYQGSHRTATERTINQNEWVSYVLRMIPSSTSSGIFETWRNGVKIDSKSGITAYGTDLCNNLMSSPYLKMGVYKWNWQAGRPATQSTVRELYLDNIKIARTNPGANDGFSLVYTPISGSPPPADTTAPTLSAIASTNITSTSATITFTSNEASDTRVDYGTTTAYGSNVTNASLVTSHSINITGLTASTTYNYKVTSKDASNNTAVSGNFTFSTLASTTDTTPPIISNIQFNPSDTSATVSWTTNELATRRIICTGISSLFFGDYNLSHSILIQNLSPETTYTNCKISSRDVAGNLKEEPGYSFTTLETSASVPIVSNVQISGITSTGATITWDTNLSSDSTINYGVSDLIPLSAYDATLTTTHSVNLTGLDPNKTYYYKPASAAAGTVGYGSLLTFKTRTISGLETDEFNSWLDRFFFNQATDSLAMVH